MLVYLSRVGFEAVVLSAAGDTLWQMAIGAFFPACLWSPLVVQVREWLRFARKLDALNRSLSRRELVG